MKRIRGIAKYLFYLVRRGNTGKIIDNGKGFEINAAKEKISDHTSLATIITKERLALINRNKKTRLFSPLIQHPV